MYWKREERYGNRITIRKYHSFDAQGQKRRRRKQRPTEESVRRANERNAERKLRMLLINNFDKGDQFLTLTYRDAERPDAELAKKTLRNFLRRLRRSYEAKGHSLKYIVVTEWQGKNIHHHMVINNIPELPSMLVDQWGHGGIHSTPLYKDHDYGGLAAYLIKETSKTYNQPGSPFRQRWTCSKNLEQPQVEKQLIRADSWREEPKVPETLQAAGYMIDRDSIINGVDIFGYPFQEYTMINRSWTGERSGSRTDGNTGYRKGAHPDGHHAERDRG